MYFIDTDEWGFEMLVFPSKEDAEHHILKLRKHVAYSSATFTIRYISQDGLAHACDDMT